MKRQEAIEQVLGYGEDDGPESYAEAAELFEAIFGRRAEAADGDAGMVYSHVCAAVFYDEDKGALDRVEVQA